MTRYRLQYVRDFFTWTLPAITRDRIDELIERIKRWMAENAAHPGK